MPINTGPYGMRGRRTRGGRRGNRFSNPSPAATSPAAAGAAPNQFYRDDSTPIQAQAPGLVPNTGATTPAAGTPGANTPINVSMPSSSGTVNTNPSQQASMPGTMMNATTAPGSTGIQAPGTQIDQLRTTQQTPPMNQVGPNTPMQVQMPAAGINTNPTNTNPTNTPLTPQPPQKKPLFQNSRLSSMAQFYR